MSENKVEHLEAVDTLAKAKGFWEKFKKPVTYIGLAVILLGGGYLAYNKYVAEPNEKAAAEAIFKAQEYFAADSCSWRFLRSIIVKSLSCFSAQFAFLNLFFF